MRPVMLRTNGPRRGRKPDGAGRAMLLSISALAGCEVRNWKDERLGSLHDVMLDADSGSVRFAVLSSRGFLGVGERLLAVPWSALHFDAEHDRFLLDMDVDGLKAAPGFDGDRWPDMADETWAAAVHSYYGTGLEPPLN